MLPSYSPPDFSPMEEAFSKLSRRCYAWGPPRHARRRRSSETLLEEIGRALDAITPEDAKGWFDHCGYAVAQSL